MRLFSSLRSSLIGAFCLSILIPMLAISLYGHLFTAEALRGRLLEDSQADAQLQAMQLLNALDTMANDANYLGMLPSVLAWQASQDSETLRAAVEADMLVFIAAHPQIYRLHWLNADGHPVVSINSDIRSVYPMSPDERRRYADGGYFAETMLNAVDGVRVSFGNSDDTDVLLYSLRFSDSAIIFEIFSSSVLEHINATGQAWAVLNADGEHLLFPQTFGFEEAIPATDAAISPLMASFEGENGAFITGESLFAYSRFEAFAGETWLLYLQKASAEIDGSLSQFRLSSAALIGGAICLAVFLGLWIGNDLLRPILALKAEAESLAKGEAIKPSYYRLKELDGLSNSIQQMARSLADESEEKRQLINKLIDAQENESKRIAYDLHDGLIQQLVGARLYLSMASDKSENGIKSDLERGSTALSEAIIEARRILQGLHPTILDDLGLADAITEVANQQAERYQWNLELSIAPLPELSKKIAVTLFRIVQEALNNVGKHAEAEHVRIHVSSDRELRLSIQDDGKGFNLASLNGRGLGINTMRERAELFGGNCRIETKPMQGTRIVVSLPLEE